MIPSAKIEARIRRFLLPSHAMAEMLRGTLCVSNLPKDANIAGVSAGEAFHGGGIVVYVQSQEFDKVELGCEIPIHMMEYTTIAKEK